MLLYQNKKEPWRHICIRKTEYEKHLFFNVKRVPNNKWLTPPRVFMHINLFLFSLWRDNANFCIGLGFGKKQFQLVFHS
jgi:hypothetical protein